MSARAAGVISGGANTGTTVATERSLSPWAYSTTWCPAAVSARARDQVCDSRPPANGWAMAKRTGAMMPMRSGRPASAGAGRSCRTGARTPRVVVMSTTASTIGAPSCWPGVGRTTNRPSPAGPGATGPWRSGGTHFSLDCNHAAVVL